MSVGGGFDVAVGFGGDVGVDGFGVSVGGRRSGFDSGVFVGGGVGVYVGEGMNTRVGVGDAAAGRRSPASDVAVGRRVGGLDVGVAVGVAVGEGVAVGV